MLDPQIETRARAYYSARADERADVVAWLRKQKWTTRVLDRIADAIESGEHLRGDDE